MVCDIFSDISYEVLRDFKINIFKNIRPFEVKIRYVLWSLSRINKPKIGEVVYYDGQIGMLIQGVKNPYWDIYFSDENDCNNFTIKHIHVKDFKMRPLWKRFKFSFQTSYDFQIGYWYSIDVYKPVGCGVSYN
jgi:hypothetical protein